MSSAALEIEPGSKVVDGTCDHCGQPMTRVTSFVMRDGDVVEFRFQATSAQR